MVGAWPSWLLWALLSALFAALTAILAKVGVEGINSDLATFIRTLVIAVVFGAIIGATGNFQSLDTIAPRTWLFLGLSVLPRVLPGFAISAL